jgi:hypothetical protein
LLTAPLRGRTPCATMPCSLPFAGGPAKVTSRPFT